MLVHNCVHLVNNNCMDVANIAIKLARSLLQVMDSALPARHSTVNKKLTIGQIKSSYIMNS